MEYINSIQFTAGTGTGTYYGDLCDNTDCMVFRPQTSVGIIYRNSERLLFRSEFNYIMLYGEDKGGLNNTRNLHFRSHNYEITASAIYDLIPYERKFRYRSPITPYAFGGLGVTSFNPQAKINNEWLYLRPLETEGVSYSSITPVISYGFGLRYKLTPEINISAEAGYRWTFTDYLDDVSTVYIDNSTLEGNAALLADQTKNSGANPKAADYDKSTLTWNAGHKRGNPDRNDGYFLFGFKVEYRIKYTEQSGGIFKRAKFR